MGYVIAAYAVTFAAVGAYWVHLVRERRRLEGALGGVDRRPGRSRGAR